MQSQFPLKCWLPVFLSFSPPLPIPSPVLSLHHPNSIRTLGRCDPSPSHSSPSPRYHALTPQQCISTSSSSDFQRLASTSCDTEENKFLRSQIWSSDPAQSSTSRRSNGKDCPVQCWNLSNANNIHSSQFLNLNILPSLVSTQTFSNIQNLSKYSCSLQKWWKECTTGTQDEF